ncbi:MAG: FtsX-like permease family protein [Candidatus Paceibacterota bacterium]
MNVLSLTASYSYRLVKREWRRFVLPFLSLVITAIVMSLVLLLTSSSALLLEEQAKDLQGGDVVLESTSPIEADAFWQATGISPKEVTSKISFSGTLQSLSETSPFSLEVIDSAYPLYGEFVLAEGEYVGVNDQQILLDQTGVERLSVTVGDAVTFGEQTFTVSGIVVSEPTSLFGGFRFLPKAFISTEGFISANVDPQLLRAEYSVAGKFDPLSLREKEVIREVEKSYVPKIDVDIAGQEGRGLRFGLQTVTDFLVVAVLITSVLAAVNIYSSTLYLVTVERKSLAVLLALGINKRTLVGILGSALLYVVIFACLIGILLGALVFSELANYIGQAYLIDLPTPDYVLYALICSGLIIAIAVASFVPATRQSLALNPRQILIGGGDVKQKIPLRTVLTITFFTLLPLVALATFLLGSLIDGLLVMVAIILVYVLVSGVFAWLLSYVYKKRQLFSSPLRSIISQKKADGLFGVVSFTSLFVALTALSTLSLLQISLQSYLENDLSSTIPTTYVLDIQPSQKDAVTEAFPDLNLFANIPARIVSIDDLQVQAELAVRNPEVDRELGREFNITSDTEIPNSDQVTKGVWGRGRAGEISVEESFAERANIDIGSTLVFTVQGFEVSGTVTSLRSTDTRSGLPYFYFIFSPEDLANFPGVYFGYADYEPTRQKELGKFLATNMPNVSVIETQNIGSLVVQIVSTLLVMILVVTFPPLLIATLLIATLVVSSYASRRREGARIRAIGGTKVSVLKLYLAETVSLTLLAAVSAYLLSIVVTWLVSEYFLKLDQVILFNSQLIFGLSIIGVFVGLIGLYLFKTDTMPLRELMSYETNQ